MTKQNYDVYGLGNALVDTEIEVTDADLAELGLEKGLMTLIDETQLNAIESYFSDRPKKQACGGSAANSILAAQLFDTNCYYNCKVANDELGQFYTKDLLDHNIGTNLSQQPLPTGTTGRCLVLITPDAERTMTTFLGITSTIGPEDVDEAAIKASKWVYIEGYLVTSEVSKAAAIKAKTIAQENGIPVAFTLSDSNIINFFYDQLTDVIGEGVDLLFCNESEAKEYSKTNTIDEAIEVLQSKAKSLAITLGKEGAQVLHRVSNTNYNRDDIIKNTAPQVKAIDSNGAGDCFAGAFIASIVQGKNAQEAGDIACKAAGHVVSHFGPRLQPSFFVNN